LETSLKRVSIDDSRYALLIEEAPRPAVAIRRVAEQLRPDLLVVRTRGQCPRAINPGHCERGV
jgi:hypothetical protein